MHSLLFAALTILVATMAIVLPLILLFILDDIVLNKHFTKRLHKYLGVD